MIGREDDDDEREADRMDGTGGWKEMMKQLRGNHQVG